jgi:hypothetical protein
VAVSKTSSNGFASASSFPRRRESSQAATDFHELTRMKAPFINDIRGIRGCSLYSSPKGSNKSAQGNALGKLPH